MQKEMKRTILGIAAAAGFCLTATAQKTTIVSDVSVDKLNTERSGSLMVVNMNIDMSALDVDANRAVLLTPRIVNGADSVELSSIGVYGRRRYYYYVRNGESMLSGKDETVYRASSRPDTMTYRCIVPYRDWMDNSTLALHRSDWGCCNSIVAEQDGLLGHHREAFFPEPPFTRAKVDSVKTRSLSGEAFIDFVVDKIVFRRDYHDNDRELAKIENTIRPLHEDKDITINRVWLKGFASPESPYAHNTYLAKGRTQALKTHIKQLYAFDDEVIETDYEPENWEGLRDYVAKSNLDHRNEIIALIDSDMKPDPKEDRLRRLYPKEYRFLLDNCYPYLRRTKYRIDYTIRSYSNVDEIKRVMAEKPQNLSLDEFYLLANKYDEGSKEFSDVYETAVRMYPNDTIANLNAGNAAIRRDDFAAARKYLAKAGRSAATVCAYGVLAVREKDYDTARRYLGEAKDMGYERAAAILEELDRRLGVEPSGQPAKAE